MDGVEQHHELLQKLHVGIIVHAPDTRIVFSNRRASELLGLSQDQTHKKAKEFEEAKIELEEAIVQIREQLATLPDILNAVLEKRHGTVKLCKSFMAEVVILSGKIRPNWIFSAAKQQLFALFGKYPYAREQAVALEHLTKCVSDFLTAFGISEEAQFVRMTERKTLGDAARLYTTGSNGRLE